LNYLDRPLRLYEQALEDTRRLQVERLLAIHRRLMKEKEEKESK